MRKQLNYQLNQQDMLDFNIFYTYNTPSLKFTRNMNKYAYSLAVTVLGVALVTLLNLPNFIAIGVIMIGFLRILLFNWDIERKLKRSIKRRVEAGGLILDAKNTVRFDADCFVVTIGKETSVNKYSDIEHAAVGKDGLYLFMNSKHAHILPRRIFEDDGEFNETVNFINGKIRA